MKPGYIRIISFILAMAVFGFVLAGCKGKGKLSDNSGGTNSSVDSELNGETSDESGSSNESDTSEGENEFSGTGNNTSGSSKGPTSQTGSTASTPAAAGGYTFTYATVYGSKYTQGAGMDDMAKAWNTETARVEKKLGCTIKLKTYGDASTLTDTISKAILAGDKVADVIEVPMYVARNLIKQGVVKDQKSLPGLNLSSANFDQAISKGMTFSNKIYGSNIGVSTSYTGVFFNIDMVKKYIPKYNIYELYKKGEWTWDKFEEIAIATTKDGKYGFASNSNMVGQAFSSNCGGTAIRNENNEVKFVMGDQPGINALIWVKKLYKDLKVFKNTPNWTDAKNIFVNGNCAMFPFYIYTAVTEIGPAADFDYGFVPFPKGPAKSNYVSSFYDCSVYVVPKTIDKPEQTGAIYNELSNFTGTANTLYEQKLKDSGLSNDGIEAFRFLKKNAVMDFSGVPGMDTYAPKIDASVFQDSKEPQTEIEAIRDACQKMFNDFYTKIK